MKPDGTYVSNGWLQLDDKKYYMDENGVKINRQQLLRMGIM